MNNRGLTSRINRGIIPFFECSVCHRPLREGEFLAVIGKTPPTGLSMPIGRADALLERIGKVCCEGCFTRLARERDAAFGQED
jgi:hypothetical protein